SPRPTGAASSPDRPGQADPSGRCIFSPCTFTATESRGEQMASKVLWHVTMSLDQTAGGKVLWHFTMSLDGFVAGPNHEMDWMTGTSFRPGLVEEDVETTGAGLGGGEGWDHYPDANSVHGGAWNGPIFVLTHHP